MSEDRSVFGRLAQRTLQTCVRGLVQAIVAVAGVPLFVASLLSLLTLAAGIGILLAPRSLLAVRGLASGQRRWALEWSRVSIATPYRPRPVEITNGLIGRLQRCKWLLTDPATWRDLLWLLVNMPAGVVLGLLPAFLVVAGVWTFVLDVGNLLFGWWPGAPPGFWGQVFFLSMLPLGVLLGPRLLKAHAQVASSLLAPTLLAEARSSSGQALVDLRTLVRGIHPPVLAERGLDGAVRALTLSLPLPVDLHIDLAGRASAPVESALYFAIAEALANVIKHSGANRAWVQLEYDSGKLVAIVGDNGTGGAELSPGGGLSGVERRLAAFDGVIAVTSPVGGPTLVTMELPCELSWART